MSSAIEQINDSIARLQLVSDRMKALKAKTKIKSNPSPAPPPPVKTESNVHTPVSKRNNEPDIKPLSEVRVPISPLPLPVRRQSSPPREEEDKEPLPEEKYDFLRSPVPSGVSLLDVLPPPLPKFAPIKEEDLLPLRTPSPMIEVDTSVIRNEISKIANLTTTQMDRFVDESAIVPLLIGNTQLLIPRGTTLHFHLASRGEERISQEESSSWPTVNRSVWIYKQIKLLAKLIAGSGTMVSLLVILVRHILPDFIRTILLRMDMWRAVMPGDPSLQSPLWAVPIQEGVQFTMDAFLTDSNFRNRISNLVAASGLATAAAGAGAIWAPSKAVAMIGGIVGAKFVISAAAITIVAGAAVGAMGYVFSSGIADTILGENQELLTVYRAYMRLKRMGVEAKDMLSEFYRNPNVPVDVTKGIIDGTFSFDYIAFNRQDLFPYLRGEDVRRVILDTTDASTFLYLYNQERLADLAWKVENSKTGSLASAPAYRERYEERLPGENVPLPTASYFTSWGQYASWKTWLFAKEPWRHGEEPSFPELAKYPALWSAASVEQLAAMPRETLLKLVRMEHYRHDSTMQSIAEIVTNHAMSRFRQHSSYFKLTTWKDVLHLHIARMGDLRGDLQIPPHPQPKGDLQISPYS